MNSSLYTWVARRLNLNKIYIIITGHFMHFLCRSFLEKNNVSKHDTKVKNWGNVLEDMHFFLSFYSEKSRDLLDFP